MLKKALNCFIILASALLANGQEKPLELVGATLIDVANYGNTTNDFPNSVVIIQKRSPIT